MSAVRVGEEGYPPEIIGYAQPWIVAPGDSVAIKVSTLALSILGRSYADSCIDILY